MPQTPEEHARSHARSADQALDDAAKRAAFGRAVDDVTSRQSRLDTVGTEIARARARGWAWAPEWESTLTELRRAAPDAAKEARSESSAAASRIKGRLDACRALLTRTSVTPANSAALARIEQEADAIRSTVQAEETRLEALVRPFVEPFDRLERDVTEAHVHLDRFDAATFRLQAGEHPWLTAEVAWQDAPGGAVSGLLYLSDKRFRFERKEKVATKKFLFITTASEEKHECLIDEPIGNVARSDDSTKGMIFKDQLIALTWQNTRVQKTTFDMNSGGTAKDWDTRIEELRTGQLAHRMASAQPSGTHGMPIDPPTVCAGCAAALDAPVRGMSVLVCKYCGQRHDLRFA